MRANEAHLRLAFMHKVLGNHKSSRKHYQLALVDISPCTFTKLQSKYLSKYIITQYQCKFIKHLLLILLKYSTVSYCTFI